MDEGSKVLVDWGAVLKGYRSDLTRTFRTPFQVSPSRKNRQERVGFDLERIHDALVRAQDEAIKLLREGVTAKEVDDAARTVLAETTIPGLEGTLNDYFTHGLGHGIGLETHELPRIRQNSTDVLEAGMVVTIEPGVYIPVGAACELKTTFSSVVTVRSHCHRSHAIAPHSCPKIHAQLNPSEPILVRVSRIRARMGRFHLVS